MNFRTSPRDLAVFYEIPLARIAHEAELFLENVVVPSVLSGRTIAARPRGHPEKVEKLAYGAIYFALEEDSLEVALTCYIWALRHLECRYQLVSIYEPTGGLVPVDCAKPEYTLVASVLGLR
jgi:hypothetical protein